MDAQLWWEAGVSKDGKERRGGVTQETPPVTPGKYDQWAV